jgi:general nucleoside transport system permease protein
MDDQDFLMLGSWIAASLRSATPLLIVMLGETLTQRTGVINLGVEGEMLMGACVAFAVAATTGSPLMGLFAGALAGDDVVDGSCRARACSKGTRSDPVSRSGLGLTSYFGRTFVGGRVSPFLPLGAHLPNAPLFARAVLDQITATAPAALMLAVIAGLWLYRTRTGLNWRTVGESAGVARALGIHPVWVRLQAILVGGLFAGLGGAILSVDYTQTSAQDVTNGKALIAVGLGIVARWNPFLLIPTLLFGLSETSVLKLQAGGVAISPSLLATVPYFFAILVVVFAQAQGRRSAAMPADLTAIFRTR